MVDAHSLTYPITSKRISSPFEYDHYTFLSTGDGMAILTINSYSAITIGKHGEWLDLHREITERFGGR